MKININSKEVEITETTLSYERIVELAGMQGNPSMMYRMKNTMGDRSVYAEGILAPGEVVKEVWEGARFTVCHTNRA